MRKLLALLVFSSACVVGVPANAIVYGRRLGAGREYPRRRATAESSELTTFNSQLAPRQFRTSAIPSHGSPAGATICQGALTRSLLAPPVSARNRAWPIPPITLSVFGGTTETITSESHESVWHNVFGLYIGSLDTYNTITFYNGSDARRLWSNSAGAMHYYPVPTACVGPALRTGPPLANQSGFVANRYVVFSEIGPSPGSSWKLRSTSWSTSPSRWTTWLSRRTTSSDWWRP